MLFLFMLLFFWLGLNGNRRGLLFVWGCFIFMWNFFALWVSNVDLGCNRLLFSFDG